MWLRNSGQLVGTKEAHGGGGWGEGGKGIRQPHENKKLVNKNNKNTLGHKRYYPLEFCSKTMVPFFQVLLHFYDPVFRLYPLLLLHVCILYVSFQAGLGFFGNYVDGIPEGFCWKQLRGGSWIYGEVNDEGHFTGRFK